MQFIKLKAKQLLWVGQVGSDLSAALCTGYDMLNSVKKPWVGVKPHVAVSVKALVQHA
jgi:hypothetical protein